MWISIEVTQNFVGMGKLICHVGSCGAKMWISFIRKDKDF